MKHFLGNFVKKPYKHQLWVTIIVIGVMAYLFSSYLRTKEFFEPGLTEPMVTYYSEYGKFVINHPENWKGVDTPQGDHGDRYSISIIKPFRTWPSLVIAARDNTNGDLEQIVDWGKERAKENEGYREEYLRSFRFPNIQGILCEYIWKTHSPASGQIIVHCTDYYFLNQDRGYALTFCADDPIWNDAKNVFQKMIESFEFR
jgi:hypothetical protein